MTLSLAAKWLLPWVAAASLVAQQPEPAVVRGRAVDRDGKPVEGCVVGLFEQGERFTTKELFAKPLATTDASGRYELRAKKNSSQDVVVTTRDHQVCVQHLLADASAERVLPDALMLPGTTLRGRVRDAAGKPIAGALVRVEDPLARDFGVMAWFASQAVSDERGIFEVPGVPRTGLLVTASALGFPAVSRFAAHDSPLDLTLVATGVVRGRVVGADGKPAANVEVDAITVEQRPGRSRWLRMATDAFC
jgi:protocatechuate 3,4-dioxygenase beta subunit